MKKLIISVICFTFLFLLTFPASGGDIVKKPNYIAVKGGIYSPESDDLEDFDTGFNIEVSYGRYFHPNFALEVGLGYFQTEATFDAFDPILGYLKEEDKISVIPLTIAAKGVYPTKYVELFIKAGIGAYFASIESDISIGALGSFDIEDTDTAFGFHLGGGADFNITKNMFLGIEAKYLWAGAEFEDDILGVPIEADADLDGFTITGIIGVRF